MHLCVLVSRMGWFLSNYIWADFCLVMYLSQEWAGFPSRNIRADFYRIMYLFQKFADFSHIRDVLMYLTYLVSTTLGTLKGHQRQKKFLFFFFFFFKSRQNQRCVA